jgi:hypothetical protein
MGKGEDRAVLWTRFTLPKRTTPWKEHYRGPRWEAEQRQNALGYTKSTRCETLVLPADETPNQGRLTYDLGGEG